MLVFDEFQDHDAVFDDRFLEPEFDAYPPHPNDVEQLAGRFRNRAETVDQIFLEKGQPPVVCDVVEFAVQADFLGGTADVSVRDKGFAVGVDLRVGDVRGRLRRRRFAGRLAGFREFFFAQFGDRLVQDFLIGFEADIGDETALFAAQ